MALGCERQCTHGTTKIKRRLAEECDLTLKKWHLRGIGAKLGGPLSNQTVGPGNGLISHRCILMSPPVGAGLRIGSPAAGDGKKIISPHRKLNIYTIYCHCLVISHG